MREMICALDFEFTNLHESSELISIGLACVNGDVFYGEFTDFSKEHVSEFVHEQVLPHIQAKLVVPMVRGTKLEVSNCLEKWLITRPCIAIYCDSAWDQRHLESLIPSRQCPVITVVDLSSRQLAEDAQSRFFRGSGHVRHHALHDAQALLEALCAARLGDASIE